MKCCAGRPSFARHSSDQQLEPSLVSDNSMNLRPADIVALQQKIDELRGLRTAEVRELAEAAGIDEAQLDATDEALDTRTALTDLIIAKEIAAARVERSPPEGTPSTRAIVTTDAIFLGTSSDHVPLSEPAVEESAADMKAAVLRSKLETLRVSELKRQALLQGAEQSLLDQADDAENPKRTLIELVVAMEMQSSTRTDTRAREEQLERLRAELRSMRVSALKQRAVAAGIEQAQLDEADDDEDG
eukprot:SAG22_NODE_5250_length_1052_cov_5.716684_2_plen_244_part_01